MQHNVEVPELGECSLCQRGVGVVSGVSCYYIKTILRGQLQYNLCGVWVVSRGWAGSRRKGGVIQGCLLSNYS